MIGLINPSQVHSYQHGMIQMDDSESELLFQRALWGFHSRHMFRSAFFLRYLRQENGNYTKHVYFSISLLSSFFLRTKEKRQHVASFIRFCLLLHFPHLILFFNQIPFFCWKNLSLCLGDLDVTPERLS